MTGVGMRSPLARLDRGVGPGDLGLRGADVRPVGQRRLDHRLLVDRRDVAGQGELAERLGGAGRLGDADLVAEVGQGRQVVLPGRLDRLPRPPALDPRQGRVGRGDLTLAGLELALERRGQAVVEVGELLGQAVLLAAVGRRLEEAVGLDQGGQLGLDHVPLLLLDRRPWRCGSGGSSGAPARPAAGSRRGCSSGRSGRSRRGWLACPLPPGLGAAERVGRDQGDRPVVDPDGGVERGGEVARDLDGLGRGRDRVPLPQRHQVGVAGQGTVEGQLEADRLAAQLGGIDGRRHHRGGRRLARHPRPSRQRRGRQVRCAGLGPADAPRRRPADAPPGRRPVASAPPAGVDGRVRPTAGGACQPRTVRGRRARLRRPGPPGRRQCGIGCGDDRLTGRAGCRSRPPGRSRAGRGRPGA